MSTEEWCECDAFVLWYEEAGIYVCKCGHPRAQHSDGIWMCHGVVIRHRAHHPLCLPLKSGADHFRDGDTCECWCHDTREVRR